MPYIKIMDRRRLDPTIKKLADMVTKDGRAGELNYIITNLLLLTEGEGRYKDFNELMGVLESAKLEFYRRRVAPYEDKKIKKNGDIKKF